MTLKELQRTPVGTLLLWKFPYRHTILNNLHEKRFGIVMCVTKNEITVNWQSQYSGNASTAIYTKTYDRNDKQDLTWCLLTTTLAKPSDR